MVFGNGVKNIQAAAYNGAHTVIKSNGASTEFYGPAMLKELKNMQEFEIKRALFLRAQPDSAVKCCRMG